MTRIARMEGARSPALSVLPSAGILAVCEETVMAAREHRDYKDGFSFVRLWRNMLAAREEFCRSHAARLMS